jgi:hypothetical protein
MEFVKLKYFLLSKLKIKNTKKNSMLKKGTHSTVTNFNTKEILFIFKETVLIYDMLSCHIPLNLFVCFLIYHIIFPD